MAILELLATITGVLSVWYARNNNVLVFPTGIISVLIYVFITYENKIYAEAGINIYYFVMSVYAKRKNTRRVEELFETMIEENVPQDVFTYTTLMKACGTNSTKAEVVLKRMKKAGVKPDVFTYTTLMNAYGTNHNNGRA